MSNVLGFCKGCPSVHIRYKAREDQLLVSVHSEVLLLADHFEADHIIIVLLVTAVVTSARVALLAAWPDYKSATDNSNRQVQSCVIQLQGIKTQSRQTNKASAPWIVKASFAGFAIAEHLGFAGHQLSPGIF